MRRAASKSGNGEPGISGRRHESGFTLIEVMVAIVIMLVALLGMLHSLNIATEHNLRNHLREEAVLIADEKLNELKIRQFDNLSTTYGVEQAPSRLRGVDKSYSVRKSTEAVGPNTRTLAVRISWSYKNMSSSHELRTVKAR